MSDPQRCRCAIGFAVGGDLRFISHHDVLRLFRRALARAVLPVSFTEGFNPHPRMVIPLPRPVGIASRAEMLVVEFADPVDPDDVLRRLGEQMPAGLELSGGRLLAPGEKLRPVRVSYRLDVGDSPPADLEARVHRIAEADVLEVLRPIFKSGRTRIVDVRPFLLNIRAGRDSVCFTLQVTGAGTAKPAEIAGLLGFDTTAMNHRICRTEVHWQ